VLVVVRAQSAKRIIIPISRRAVTSRLIRALARDGKQLKRARTAQTRDCIGEYFITDTDGIVSHHLSLGQLARELGVLRPYERFVED
jgi:hypothetical protein